MKFKFLATSILAVPLCLATTVRAENTLQFRQLGAIQPSVLVAQSDWSEFSSASGGFAVLMPGTPKEESETSDDGSVEYSYTLSLEKAAFLVHYTDIPNADELSAEEIQELLDGTPADFAKGAEAKLLGTRSISIDDNPGKEFEFTLSDGTPGKARVYMVKKRLYVVVGMTSESENTERFLNSFRLL
ncbi:hypothetical protein [Argonema antarcticum]|uniref:hypothetical protein n=1 Tax=Argonema antarcticum TaxID=2942763 RepID=UPI0020131355|nr:hypothetical protein [Argonema antarcticum]MCL1469636.1 hypothetical protein [Argonema antarcticum A004/B2]